MRVAEIPAPYEAAVRRAEAECRAFFGGSLRSLALFGSVARGDPRPTSDVDLLAIVDDAPASGHARVTLLYPLIRRIETAPEFRPLRSEGRLASLSIVLRTVREMTPTPWLLFDVIARESEASIEAGEWHRAVRKCQESAEPALKGLLRYLGAEYPKVHRIGDVVRSVLGARGGDEAKADRMGEMVDLLAQDREMAFYGSDDGRPPEALFDRDAAEQVRAMLLEVLGFVDGIMGPPPRGPAT